MANTERKARKRAGIQFTKPAKIGTPLSERAIPFVMDSNGKPSGVAVQHPSKRYAKKLQKTIEFLGLDKPAAPVKKSRSKKAATA